MSDNTKPLVLVFGATGVTGKSIVQGLLDSGVFRVAATARSANRPEVQQWLAAGVQIHILDITTASTAELQAALRGVDTLVSTAPGYDLDLQRPLIAAAAAAGVKRFVPSAFGPSAPQGAMTMHDHKLEILEYAKSLGLSWTWINVGWWIQLSLPIPANAAPATTDIARFMRAQSLKFYGDGAVRCAFTDLNDVGRVTARVLQDKGTENKFVFAYGEELTQREVWEIAKEFSPDGEELEARKTLVSHDAVRQVAEQVFSRDDPLDEKAPIMGAQYMNSIHIRGDNVASKAKERGELIFNERHPDFKFVPLRDAVERFYREQKYDQY